MTESQIQKSILELLDAHPKVAKSWRQNNGTARMKGFYVKFGFPGQPDICGFLKDGRGLFVEVKDAKGLVRPEQAEFLELASRSGCIAIVARSVDDVMAALV